MKKLADVALLPFYCQNTLVAMLLINFLMVWNFEVKNEYEYKKVHRLTNKKIKQCNAVCYVPSFVNSSYR